MRIVTWNLGIAYGSYKDRHEAAWRALLAMEPDIALVQEVVVPAWLPAGWQVAALPVQHWGSAIVSRLPLTPILPDPASTLGRFGAYLALASVTLPDGETATVASVHARANPASARLLGDLDPEALRRPSVPDPWWNDVAWHGIADVVRGGRFIVGGDWNVSRYADKDGHPEPDGRELIERAEADGWVDLHHRVLGREERSWFGTVGPREHQPDIIFSDTRTAAAVRGARVEQRLARDERLSDHAPVIVEVDHGG